MVIYMTTAQLIRRIERAESLEFLNMLMRHPAADRDCLEAAQERATDLMAGNA